MTNIEKCTPMKTTIKPLTQVDDAFIDLVYAFRAHGSELNNAPLPSRRQAKIEASSYIGRHLHTFGAYYKGTLDGFIVLKETARIYWVHWLFVTQTKRRQGIASRLFKHAEAYAKQKGETKLYIWVHPDNKAMLAFLTAHGYDALNLIEITKKAKTKGKTITVFDHTLKY